MTRVVLVSCAVALGFVVGIAWLFSRAHAREREAVDTAAAGDLYGLATAVLPRGYRALGLDGADRSLSPAEQLARHDERAALAFRFTKDPSNDWGGYPKDPEVLNIVLLPPSMREKPEKRCVDSASIATTLRRATRFRSTVRAGRLAATSAIAGAYSR